ncbi:MAG: RodZ domain-containing protein [Thermoflexales bacterium]
MTSDLARRLRAAREARGVSLRDAERETKIRRRYLEAIEQGQFERLPDGPAARGFVRLYARFLGMDPDRALSDLEAEVGVPLVLAREKLPPPPSFERQRQASKLTQLVSPTLRWRGELPDEQATELNALAEPMASSPTLPGRANGGSEQRLVMVHRVPTLPARRSSFRLRKPSTAQDLVNANLQTSHVAKPRTRAMPLHPRNASPLAQQAASILLVLALLAVSGFVVVNLVLPWARENLLASSGQASEMPKVKVTVFAGAQPTAALMVVTPSAPMVVPQRGLQIALDVREAAWLRVRVDGRLIYSDTPPLGLTPLFEAERSVALETNNGGAFEVILNGQRVGPLGPKGERIQKVWGGR